MYLVKIWLTLLLVFLLSAQVVNAKTKNINFDKRQQIKAMVEQAVVMAIVDGKQALLKEISSKNGKFIDKNLYLFVGSLDRITVLAHPYNKELIGKDLSLLNDGRGNYISFKLAKKALEKGAGWVKYYWNKPNSRKKELKNSYVMKVPTKNYYVGGGYYK